MEKYEFSGKWISCDKAYDKEPVNVFHRQIPEREIPSLLEKNLHVLYRKDFYAEKSAKTEIKITADDYYMLYINGRFVGEGPAPCFNTEYYYNTFDISEYIRDGKNVIAVHSYYQGLINRVFVSGDDRQGLLFDIICGGKVVAKSDDTVRFAYHDGYTAFGTVGYETQYLEKYDSGAVCDGFERPDYDDSRWSFAAYKKFCDYTTVSQPSKNLCHESISPVSEKNIGGGVLYDFGSTYVGRIFVKAHGKRGDEITLRFGQELLDDGNVRFNMRCNCRYEEKWVLSGNADGDVLLNFDYKSFRYSQLILPEGVKIDGISFEIRHYPFTLKRGCKYDDPELLRIFDLCVHSLQYGTQDVIQDCMDREKGQYLGDGSLTTSTLSVLTDDTAIMEKFIDNALATDFINEGLMICSPCSFMQEIADYTLMLPHVFKIHYALRRDKSFIEKRYGKLCRMLDFFREHYEKQDGLLYDLDKWCLVDWPENARDGYDFELPQCVVIKGTHNVINAYYYGAVKCLNALAKIIGKPPYRDPEMLKKAYVSAFFDKEKHLFRDTPTSDHSAIASNVFAVLFGLCDDEKAIENTLDMIMTKPAENSAFFTTFASMYVLRRMGDEDKLVRYIKNDGRWNRMLSEGATTTFEAWGKDVKWNTSLFHLCYTYAALFLTDFDF